MAYSDDYLRQLSRKTAKGEILEVEAVQKLFFRYISDLPQDLCWDIFNYFIVEKDGELSTDKAERLSIVIDLIEGEYEENDLKLTDEELKFISEGVNDFALDISDDMLMNVMRAAVSRGLLG